jgi:hypothetical protein
LKEKSLTPKYFPPKLMRKKVIDTENLELSKSNKVYFEWKNNEKYDEVKNLATMLKNFLEQKNSINFLYCEFFEPDIDYGYFSKNDFIECLKELELEKVNNLTRYEWNIIRGCLGKPRRFSKVFLKEEREVLNKYRENVRNYNNNKQITNYEYEIPKMIKENQKVLIRNETKNIFQTGRVIKYDFDKKKYLIEVENNEIYVTDTNVMSENGVELHNFKSVNKEDKNSIMVFNITNCYILLNKKKKLLELLNQMNNEAEQNLIKNSSRNEFNLKYAWVIVKMKNINKSLETVINNMKTNDQSNKILNLFENNKKKSLEIINLNINNFENNLNINNENNNKNVNNDNKEIDNNKNINNDIEIKEEENIKEIKNIFNENNSIENIFDKNNSIQNIFDNKNNFENIKKQILEKFISKFIFNILFRFFIKFKKLY